MEAFKTYKLLIVDDEEYIVNSLYASFLTLNDARVQVMRAYSAPEAMRVIRQYRIDILLTDICMPQMDGMQLMERARELWPDCAVILLTGYRDFDYAYKALQTENVRYCLKSEEVYDQVHAYVSAQLNRMDEMIVNSEKELLRQRRDEVDRMMRAELLRELLGGRATDGLANELTRANSKMDASRAVCLLAARADAPDGLRASQLLCLQSADLLIEKHVSFGRWEVLAQLRGPYGAWVFQPPTNDKDAYGGMITRIAENLDRVQEALTQSTGATVSFALSDRPCEWSELAQAYHCLYANLSEAAAEPAIFVIAPTYAGDARLAVHLRELKHIFGAEGLNGLLHSLSELTGSFTDQSDFFDSDTRIQYLSLLSTVAGGAEMADASEDSKLRLIELSTPESFPSWQAVLEALKALAQSLSETRKRGKSNWNRRVVEDVTGYIDQHFTEQLSLTELAEHVHFNASYLSWLFKSVTGVNIKKYISDKRISRAVYELKNTNDRIKDIAVRNGFTSSKYFISVFRAEYGASPAEWREQSSAARE